MDTHTLTIIVFPESEDDERTITVETGLNVTVDPDTGLAYLPFETRENAVDCLRILLHELETREFDA